MPLNNAGLKMASYFQYSGIIQIVPQLPLSAGTTNETIYIENVYFYQNSNHISINEETDSKLRRKGKKGKGNRAGSLCFEIPHWENPHKADHNESIKMQGWNSVENTGILT